MSDPQWNDLSGPKGPYDPRPLLKQLRLSPHQSDLWDVLFAELHHNGRVGPASYAALVVLVKLGQTHGVFPEELFALAATIELARTSLEGGRNPEERPHLENPPVPGWLEEEYGCVIPTLAREALLAIARWSAKKQLRGAFAILLIWRGLRVYATMILEHSERDLADSYFTYPEEHYLSSDEACDLNDNRWIRTRESEG